VVVRRDRDTERESEREEGELRYWIVKHLKQRVLKETKRATIIKISFLPIISLRIQTLKQFYLIRLLNMNMYILHSLETKFL
jgi:hypothetical protein